MNQIPKKLDRYYYDWMQLPEEAKDLDDVDQKLRLRWVASHCLGDVLDVGGNTGYLAKYINCSRYVLLDLALQRVKFSKQLGVEYRVHGCGESLPFKTASFKSVVLAEVLEHVPFPALLLKEAARVGEKVIVTVPDEYGGIQHGFGTPGAHVRRYTEETLRAEVESAGLIIEEWQHLKGERMAWWCLVAKR